MENLPNDPIVCLKLVRQKMEELKKQEQDLVFEIVETHQNQIKEGLATKDYGCGTVNIGNLKIEVAKNVHWNQEGLAKLFAQIRDAGRDPSEYIKQKYDVSEASFKAWPSDIKEAFTPLRVVTPSKPKITITEDK